MHSSPHRLKRRLEQGSALILTIMMVVMLTLEFAVISLISLRGLGEEGILLSQNMAARRAAESAATRLENALYIALQSKSQAQVEVEYNQVNSPFLNQPVQTTDPDNPGAGLQNTGMVTSAWVSGRRGHFFRLSARVINGATDITSQRWARIRPCMAGQNSLLTIVSGESKPGIYEGLGSKTTAISPVDGRVYFGEDADPGSFWTWKDGVLSTLVNGESRPGWQSTVIGHDGRVFFGEAWTASGSIWTWKEGTGLSTLMDNRDSPGFQVCQRYNRVVADDGRFFWGERSNPGNIYTWKEGTGVTTVVTGIADPGMAISVTPDGRVFMGENQWWPSSLRTWKAGTPLTTIATGLQVGAMCNIASTSDGRVVFAESSDPGKVWTWKENGTANGSLTTIAADTRSPGVWGLFATQDGRIYIPEIVNPGKVLTWKNNVLTTIIPASSGYVNPGGWASMAVSPSGRMYLGNWNDPPSTLTTWKESTGLSTIATFSGHGYIGGEAIEAVPNPATDQVFFSGWSWPGIFSWKDNGTGGGLFSTIMTGVGTIGSIAVAPNGRVFFGDKSNPGVFMTWKDNGTGAGVLSTILSNGKNPGNYSVEISPGGRIFFGENDAAGNFYTWQDAESCETGRNF